MSGLDRQGLGVIQEGGAADNFETTACDVCMHVVQSDNDMSFDVHIYYATLHVIRRDPSDI